MATLQQAHQAGQIGDCAVARRACTGRLYARSPSRYQSPSARPPQPCCHSKWRSLSEPWPTELPPAALPPFKMVPVRKPLRPLPTNQHSARYARIFSPISHSGQGSPSLESTLCSWPRRNSRWRLHSRARVPPVGQHCAGEGGAPQRLPRAHPCGSTVTHHGALAVSFTGHLSANIVLRCAGVRTTTIVTQTIQPIPCAHPLQLHSHSRWRLHSKPHLPPAGQQTQH